MSEHSGSEIREDFALWCTCLSFLKEGWNTCIKITIIRLLLGWKGPREKKILPLDRSWIWTKKIHPDLDLTSGSGFEISPIPEFAPDSACIILPNPEHKIPLIPQLAPESDQKSHQAKATLESSPFPKKPYIYSLPCSVCYCFSQNSHLPGFFLPNKSLEWGLLCPVRLSPEQSLAAAI